MSKNIIISGHSMAVISFIESYRQQNQDDRITLFPCDGRLPYDRSKLVDVLGKEIKKNDIFIRPEKWFKEQGVSLILDEQISRINTTRKRVYTTAKQQFEYDGLFVTDVPTVQPSRIKGFRRSGVFALDRWASVDNLLQYLSFVDTVAIQVATFDAIKVAFLLGQLGKEVVLVFSKNNLCDEFDEETAKMMKQLLEERHIRLVDGDIITEVLGEAEMKAVRLMGGKILAAEAVLFESSDPDMRIFSQESVVSQGSLSVSTCGLKTDYEGVWAADYVAKLTSGGHLPLDNKSLCYQGDVAAKSMVGENVQYDPDGEMDFIMSSGAFTCGWFGQTKMSGGDAECSYFDSKSDSFRKIFLKDGVVKGGVFINAAESMVKIRDVYEQKTVISGVEEQILKDNFSVEDVVKMRDQKQSNAA